MSNVPGNLSENYVESLQCESDMKNLRDAARCRIPFVVTAYSAFKLGHFAVY